MAYSQMLTDVGLAKIAVALAGGDPVNITEVAVGDMDTTPAPGLTALGHEVWHGAVNAVDAVPADPSRVRIDGLVPVEDGGWTMREAGAFDADGDLILIARIPDTYKPDPETDGAGVAAYLRLTVEVANAAEAFTLTVDGSVVMATEKSKTHSQRQRQPSTRARPAPASRRYRPRRGSPRWCGFRSS